MQNSVSREALLETAKLLLEFEDRENPHPNHKWPMQKFYEALIAHLSAPALSEEQMVWVMALATWQRRTPMRSVDKNEPYGFNDVDADEIRQIYLDDARAALHALQAAGGCHSKPAKSEKQTDLTAGSERQADTTPLLKQALDALMDVHPKTADNTLRLNIGTAITAIRAHLEGK